LKKKEQFNIVLSDEKEKIVIHDKKKPPTPTKQVSLGNLKEIPIISTPYKGVKEERNEWDDWREETKIGEEEEGGWDNNWDSSKKFSKVPSNNEKPLSNTKTKFVGISTQENDVDINQREAIKKKRREENASFFDLSNESKVEYVKETAKDIGNKTVEISGVVYEKVTDFGEQVGDVVGKWWNGLMQQ